MEFLPKLADVGENVSLGILCIYFGQISSKILQNAKRRRPEGAGARDQERNSREKWPRDSNLGCGYAGGKASFPERARSRWCVSSGHSRRSLKIQFLDQVGIF